MRAGATHVRPHPSRLRELLVCDECRNLTCSFASCMNFRIRGSAPRRGRDHESTEHPSSIHFKTSRERLPPKLCDGYETTRWAPS
eukprot:63036-Pleurochrysis_carterae.AAC.1